MRVYEYVSTKSKYDHVVYIFLDPPLGFVDNRATAYQINRNRLDSFD